MPVFGADPDDDTKEWSEYEGHFARPYVSKPVNALTNHFGYHPQMKMSQVFEDKDKAILNGHFSRQLKQGHTEASIKKMIDRFWMSWGAESERPAFTFVSTKVQQELIKEAEITKNDPVLEWMLDGMPNKGPFEDPAMVRRMLLSSDEGLYRYPEVVAEILASDGFGGSMLLGLEDLIKFHLTGEGHPAGLEADLGLLLKEVHLPAELQKLTRRRLRPRRDTIKEAIAHIPLHKKLEW